VGQWQVSVEHVERFGATSYRYLHPGDGWKYWTMTDDIRKGFDSPGQVCRSGSKSNLLDPAKPPRFAGA